MTSNQERAAEVHEVLENMISDVFLDCPEGVAENMLAANCTRALAEHEPPLLAPELPRPDRDGRWWPQAASIGNVNVNPAGEVVLHSGNFRDMQLHLSPAKARDLAAILTAAAAHAEKENES